MDKNRMNEAKDKFVGGVKETTGKVFDNEELQLKGTIQKGFGKAREITGDVVDEVEDVKDKVFGTVKETTGKLTHDKGLELRGKFQKTKVRNPRTNKIIIGVGVLAAAYLIGRMISNSMEEDY